MRSRILERFLTNVFWNVYLMGVLITLRENILTAFSKNPYNVICICL